MKELNQIQTRLVAQKTQYNSFGKYKYRSCEDILAAVKPLLAETGCTLTLSDEILLIGSRFYVKATATLANQKGDVASTSALAREEEEKKGMDGSQITGTASSYARKYALNGLFAIDDTADADALNTNKEFTEKPKAKATKKAVEPTAPAPVAAPAEELSIAELLTLAKDELAQAQTANDLRNICARYPQLRTNTEFLATGTARKKALGIQ